MHTHRELTAVDSSQVEPLRPLTAIKPPEIFAELRRGVLGQDKALRTIAVAIYKHTTGKASGNFLIVGNSGTGKTTIMKNLQRLYDEQPEYRPFRAMAIVNANLLVDADRMEFRPERLLKTLEQRARAVVGLRPSPDDLQQAMENATVCLDEIDKMSAFVGGKSNPIGVVLQHGLLTLMEGEELAYPVRAWVDGKEQEVTLEIDSRKIMFICAGAFEGLYDQVYNRVMEPGSGEKLRRETILTAEGKVRVDVKFSLRDYLKAADLFEFGIVPQFLGRFQSTVMLDDLKPGVLKEILLNSLESPFVTSREFFAGLGIDLEIEDLAAGLLTEAAGRDGRLGARALRGLFEAVIGTVEFDPWAAATIAEGADGRYTLTITAAMVRQALD